MSWFSMTELRCSRDLALRLGALAPKDANEHRDFKRQGMLLVRDETLAPLFWPWQLTKLDRGIAITPRST